MCPVIFSNHNICYHDDHHSSPLFIVVIIEEEEEGGGGSFIECHKTSCSPFCSPEPVVKEEEKEKQLDLPYSLVLFWRKSYMKKYYHVRKEEERKPGAHEV